MDILEDHDVLIDVHTAGWCVPFVLIDHIPDGELRWQVEQWADATGFPVVREMPLAQAQLQGLDRSWSAWALAQGKPAFTMELSGFHALERQSARQGGEALNRVLQSVLGPRRTMRPTSSPPVRLEIYGSRSGLFEAFLQPGRDVSEGDVLGAVRSLSGKVEEEIRAVRKGLLLALQPLAAVHVGSWLATLAVDD